MKVVFSNRAYASVLAETTEKIRTETGGLFLGAYDSGVFYILEAIDPGPKSIFEVAYFEYDQAYTQHLIRKTANIYDAELQLIGLWHRHPGSFDAFSSTDDETNSKYAQLNKCGAVSALINVDPDFRITMYHVRKPCRYRKISYEIGDKLIPKELKKFKLPEKFNKMMRMRLDPKSEKADYHRSVSFKGFLEIIAEHFSEYACKKIILEPVQSEENVSLRMIDELADDITFISDDVGVEILVAQRGKHIILGQDTADEFTRMYFAYFESEDKLVFEYKGKTYYYKRGLFKKLFVTVAKQKKNETMTENKSEESEN